MKVTLLVLALTASLASAVLPYQLPDISLPFQQIVSNHGFNLEEHKVTTADGYVLTVFRIPSKQGQEYAGGKPVLLQHGIADSAIGWIVRENESPAFVLAEQGYDVWLGNSRGNKYSRQHVTLDPAKPAFWQFGWEEMGDFDMPAVIDYILQKTAHEKLALIGHSMGSTQVFYGMMQNLEFFQKRVSIFMALAPPLELNHVTSPLIKIFNSNFQMINSILTTFQVNEVLTPNWLSVEGTKVVCGMFPQLCTLGDLIIDSSDSGISDPAAQQQYLGHYPSGASLHAVTHFVQIVLSAQLQKYDYGVAANMKLYHQPTPPRLDLSTIKNIPIAMFVGNKDLLTSALDAQSDYQKMKDTVVFYKEYNLGHISYFVAKDMSYFTVDAMNLVKQYHPLPLREQLV